MSGIRMFDFKQALVLSQGTSANQAIGTILLDTIPGSTKVMQANQQNDRNGIDWWVEMPGYLLGIDCKIREEDPLPKFGKDDLALETWSVIEAKKVGWTLDDTKQTDYVFWIWKDTGRWCLAPFLLLRRAFQTYRNVWCEQFQVARQRTGHGGKTAYHSECVFVPRREVWAAIWKLSAGYSEHLAKARTDQGCLFGLAGASK